jgi:hypothetical protein
MALGRGKFLQEWLFGKNTNVGLLTEEEYYNDKMVLYVQEEWRIY